VWPRSGVGRYYLTYQDFATREQFEAAYPNYKGFLKIKQQYDPESRFTNKFYQAYLSNEKAEVHS
jgi:decaprenylphospho-beta-D-ribofuranose 2-oxidase